MAPSARGLSEGRIQPVFRRQRPQNRAGAVDCLDGDVQAVFYQADFTDGHKHREWFERRRAWIHESDIAQFLR